MEASPAQPLRPLNFGEILDVSLNVVFKNLKPLLAAVAVVIVPIQILSTVVLLSTVPDFFFDPGAAQDVSAEEIQASQSAAAIGGFAVIAIFGLLGSRAAARAVDLVLLALLVGAVALVFVVGGAFAGADALGIALFAVASFLVVLSYDVLFETLGGGRTPGKRLVGLRVAHSGGQPIGFRSSAVRNVLRLIDGPTLSWAPGIVSIIATGRNQRLGDLAADAIVVRDRVGARPSEKKRRRTRKKPPSPAPAQAPAPAPDTAGWDVSAITADELSTVRRFLDRRATFTPEARSRLAGDLHGRLAGRVAGAPSDLSPEEFLEQMAAAKAARR